MARRRNRNRNHKNNQRVARKLQPFANFVATPQRKLNYDYSSWLTDRRLTAPRAVKSYNPIYTIGGAPVVLKEKTKNGRIFYTSPVSTKTDPILNCVRRSRRRQSLFALNLTRRGSQAKKRRRDYFSSIKC